MAGRAGLDAAGVPVSEAHMIKAALFDVYGTCVNWHGGMRRTAETVLAAKGLDASLGSAIAEGWRQQYQPAMEKVRSGAEPYRPLDAIQIETLDTVLAPLGLSDSMNEDDRARLNAGWDALPAWPDAVQSLKTLKVAMPIGACSNGSVAMMGRLAAHNGLTWSIICGAELARTFKPRPAVYLASCAALGCAPAEVIMVACHPDDLDAASDAGLQTGYIPRPDEWGPATVAPDPNADRFTFDAPTLPALVEKIVHAAT